MSLEEQEDQWAREQALDPTQSFIVQAPAGSGKTELLTQRYLKLLSHVGHAPEEILAVTFTRKAQGEMRQRILEALEKAKLPAPSAPHQLKTWQLAKKVLEHGEALGWDLVQNPNRLRIMTIDALAALLVHRLPILSKFGTEPQVQPDSIPLIRQAIQQFFQTIKEDPDLSYHFGELLYHLDNRLVRLEGLLVQLLQKRDQWLEHVVIGARDPEQSLIALEESLHRIVEDELNQLLCHLDEAQREQLLSLARFAGEQVNSDTIPFHAWKSLPSSSPEALKQWQLLSKWMLTDKGEVRKKVTIKQGFPAPSGIKDKVLKSLFTERKKTMHNFLATLQNTPVASLLKRVLELPSPSLGDTESVVLRSLFYCLPILVAHLKVVFKQQGKVDFVEVAEAALLALGDEEAPTNLALSLDYQIQHILIDEFQDTSIMQFELFEKLIRGWEPGDGRTLFLVGDPQQSIYRFRGAEVGLFLKAIDFGLQGQPLTYLKLRKNFRSERHLCEWSNQAFQSIFPETPDISLGAIPLSPSLAHQQTSAGKVELYGFDDRVKEAVFIAKWVEQHPNAHTAVLVRARTHLNQLIPVLKALRIPYHAMEIESLNANQLILDLLALTQAIIDPTNRIAWLAILRAPWCGLSMRDLWILAQDATQPWLWVKINDEAIFEQLSQDGKIRLNRFRQIMMSFWQHKERHYFANWLQALWYQLGGPSCYEQEGNEHEVFFQILFETDLRNYHWSDFENKILQGFSEQPPMEQHEGKLELMTIHKSKGLEFDHVVLPCLNKTPRSHDGELLLWQERPFEDGIDLLMAPIKSPDQSEDKLYHYLKSHIQAKNHLEAQRLFYVGVTRAKKNLLLTATVSKDKEGEIKTLPSSFLDMLDSAHLSQLMFIDEAENVHNELQTPTKILAADWCWPKALEGLSNFRSVDWEADKNHAELSLGFESKVGTFVHRVLQVIAEDGVEFWQSKDFNQLDSAWRQALLELAVYPNELNKALEAVKICVQNTLRSEKGCWILSNHLKQHNEYALVNWHEHKLKTAILDRTWLDATGQRWIIDYKVVFQDEDAQGEHYIEQLNYYGHLMTRQETSEIKLGIYFPMQDRWWQTDFSSQ